MDRDWEEQNLRMITNLDRKVNLKFAELEGLDIKNVLSMMEKMRQENSSIRVRLGMLDQIDQRREEDAE